MSIIIGLPGTKEQFNLITAYSGVTKLSFSLNFTVDEETGRLDDMFDYELSDPYNERDVYDCFSSIRHICDEFLICQFVASVLCEFVQNLNRGEVTEIQAMGFIDLKASLLELNSIEFTRRIITYENNFVHDSDVSDDQRSIIRARSKLPEIKKGGWEELFKNLPQKADGLRVEKKKIKL